MQSYCLLYQQLCYLDHRRLPVNSQVLPIAMVYDQAFLLHCPSLYDIGVDSM